MTSKKHDIGSQWVQKIVYFIRNIITTPLGGRRVPPLKKCIDTFWTGGFWDFRTPKRRVHGSTDTISGTPPPCPRLDREFPAFRQGIVECIRPLWTPKEAILRKIAPPPVMYQPWLIQYYTPSPLIHYEGSGDIYTHIARIHMRYKTMKVVHHPL